MARSGYSFVAAKKLRDRYIDEVTFDYARAADGSFVDDPTARSAVILAFSLELGASPYDPGHGTSIAELQRSGFLTDPRVLESESARVGEELAEEGFLSNLEISGTDPEGNPLEGDNQRVGVIRMSWHDLTSGATEEAIYNPRKQD